MAEPKMQKVSTPDDRSLPIFSEFDELANRIRLKAYNLFARRGSSPGHALDDWLVAERELCWPAAELAERDDEFSLEVALAGFEPANVTVTATPKEIIVKAAQEAKQQSAKDEAPQVRWTQFHSNNVYRRVELPTAIDVDGVTANLDNGLLKIVARKAAQRESAAKNIEISETKAK